VSVTGERIVPHTWVVLDEIRSGSWGIGGSALGLTDVRALQARSPAPTGAIRDRCVASGT
jgi:4-oxalocrotonate tautomerase